MAPEGLGGFRFVFPARVRLHPKWNLGDFVAKGGPNERLLNGWWVSLPDEDVAKVNRPRGGFRKHTKCGAGF